MAGVLIAAYGGLCPVCDERYEIGDAITYYPKGWGHALCPADTPTLEVCPVCWIAPCTC